MFCTFLTGLLLKYDFIRNICTSWQLIGDWISQLNIAYQIFCLWIYQLISVIRNIYSIFHKIDIIKHFFVITMIKCWKVLFVYWLLYNMYSNLKGVYNLTLFVKPFMSKKGYTFQQCHSKRQVVIAWRIYEIINKAIKYEQPHE